MADRIEPTTEFKEIRSGEGPLGGPETPPDFLSDMQAEIPPDFEQDMPSGEELPPDFEADMVPPDFQQDMPTAEVYADGLLRQAFNLAEDPGEEIARVKTSIQLAKELDIPTDLAYQMEPEYRAKITGSKDVASRTFAQFMKDRLLAGAISNRLADLGWNLMHGDTSALTEIERLRAQMPQFDRKQRHWLVNLLGDVAQFTPMMAEIISQSMAGGVAGGLTATATAAILGQAGPQIAIPEEVISLPAAFMIGYGIGAKTVGSITSGRKMAGLSFLEISKIEDEQGNKVNPAIAYAGSLAIGAICGWIETYQVNQIVRAFPGGKKLLGEAINKSIQKVVTSGMLKRIVTKHVLQTLKHGVKETAEEVLQETITVTLTEAAKEINNRVKGTEFEHDWAQGISRIADQLQVFGSMTLMGGMGHAMGIVTDIAEQRRLNREYVDFLYNLDTDREVIEEFEKQAEATDEAYRKEYGIDPPTEEAELELPRVVWGNVKISEVLGGLEPREAFEKGVELQKKQEATIKMRRKIRAEHRAYIESLADHIMRPPGLSVDFYYREAIENLQAGVDPSFRQKRTIEQRERTRKFLEKYPARKEDMPAKLLRLLQKKSLTELTVRELEDIADTVDRLRVQGRKKRQLEMARERRQFVSDRDQAIENVLQGEELKEPETPVVASTVREGFLKRAGKWERTNALRPNRLFHKLDGGKEGVLFKRFVDDVNTGVDAELRVTDERLQAGEKKRTELGISLKSLTKTKVIDGIKYTVDEMLDIYAGWKNPRKRLALIYGNKITSETVGKITEALTGKERAFADYIVSEYEEHYGRLRQAHIDYLDQDLGHEPNYTPIRRTEIDYNPLQSEMAQELLKEHDLRKAYTPRGFTVKRLDIPEAYQKPIRLGLVSTWLEQVPKQERYISQGVLVKQLQRIANDSEFTKAVNQKYGKEYNEFIQHYTNQIANPSFQKHMRGIESVSRVLRKFKAIRHLAFNLPTMLRQLPSAILYLPDAGLPKLLGAASEFTDDPYALIDFVNERDPQMKRRSVEREIEELRASNKNAYMKLVSKVGREGMKGIMLMDRIAVTIGWKAVYDKSIANGMSEAEAIREAQKSTLRTQPAAHPKDLAKLYTSNEFLNWFTMFTNQLNQIYNITTYDIPSYFKRGKTGKAILSTASLGITALMIWSIGHRRLPENEKDLVEAQKEQFIASIPFLGKTILASESGWKSTDIPGQEIAEIVAEFTKGGRWNQKRINNILERTFGISGAPTTGPKRFLKFLDTGELRELIGGKPKR